MYVCMGGGGGGASLCEGRGGGGVQGVVPVLQVAAGVTCIILYGSLYWYISIKPDSSHH